MPTNVWTDTEGIDFTVEERHGLFRTRFHMAKKSQTPTVNCTIGGKPAFIVTEKIVGFAPVKEN